MTIGSANLNEHSLFNDSEVNVVVRDEELIRKTRLRLWSEHLELPEEEIDGDPAEVFERHYTQARMIDAVKAYQKILLANPKD